MSTTGVPSMTSIGPIRIRFLLISRTVTRWRPSGFGRSGDRVQKTPVSARFGSERGCTFSTLRRLSCSHVMTRISSPTFIPSRPSATDGLMSRQASGAPYQPCFGASLRFLIAERITPLGCSSKRPLFVALFFLRLCVFLTAILKPSLRRLPPWGCPFASAALAASENISNARW